MTTELLNLEEMTSSMANKFVLYNRNLRQLEALTIRALSRTNGGPPVSPVAGDTYIVDVATGAWASATINQIAHYSFGIWRFYSAIEGVRLWVNNEDIVVVYNGSAWVAQAGNDTGISALTNASVPFALNGKLVQDTGFSYNSTTDTLSSGNLSSGNITSTGQIRSAPGSLGAPGYSFSTDTDTGFYSVGAGNIDVVIDGVAKFRYDATGLFTLDGNLKVLDGSAATPPYTFNNDQDTGMYRIAANTLGLATGGSLRQVTSDTGVSFGTSSTNLYGYATFQSTSGNTVAISSLGTTTGAINTGPALHGVFHDGSSIRDCGTMAWRNESGTAGNFASYWSVTTRPNGGSETEGIRLSSTGNVGINTSSPEASAQLDVSSTTRGFLPPRMTTTQRDAIASPPNGLMLYNTTTNKSQVRAAGAWADLNTYSQGSFTPTWSNLTLGNGTTSGTWVRNGNLVTVSIRLTWGTTTSASGTFQCTNLPFTAIAGFTQYGVGNLLDSGTENHSIRTAIGESSTTLQLNVNLVSGTQLVVRQANATTPFTWTTSDAVDVTMSYVVVP